MIKDTVVFNKKILNNCSLKMKKLNIKDFFIDVFHDDKLFNNELFFIKFDHNAFEN